MKTIHLDNYGPIISEKGVGDEIYLKISRTLDTERELCIDFSNIESMATFCAKQIFGRLYIELGSEAFFKRLKFDNVQGDLQIIIRMGIENAVEEGDENK